MHLLLTDRMSCPRCGPAFGLILLAHQVTDRRIIHGEFGCPNCRDSFPVEDGFGDLRPPPRTSLDEEGRDRADSHGENSNSEPEVAADGRALRTAALMGVTDGPGMLLIKGPSACLARSVAELVPDVEVVAIDPSLRRDPEVLRVSRLMAGPAIPFFSGTMKGVLLSGLMEARDIQEGSRVLAPGGRLVLEEPPQAARDGLESAGLKVLLEEQGVLVCQRVGGPHVPLVTLRGA